MESKVTDQEVNNWPEEYVDYPCEYFNFEQISPIDYFLLLNEKYSRGQLMTIARVNPDILKQEISALRSRLRTSGMNDTEDTLDTM